MSGLILGNDLLDMNTLMMMGAVSGLMIYFGEKNPIKIGAANVGVFGIMKLWKMGRQQTTNETKIPNTINQQVEQVFGNVNMPIRHSPGLGFGMWGI